MARSFTVAQLIVRGKQSADVEGDSSISDDEWKGQLSIAYGELYQILVDSGMRYFESTQTVTTDGSSSYALPADHLATIGVDYEVDSAGRRCALVEGMVQERNQYAGLSRQRACQYALVGSNLELYPTPPSGQTYYHIYVPQPDDLSAAEDSASVDVVAPSGEQFIAWSLAVYAKIKHEADPRDAIREREAARSRVDEWSLMRALNTPRRPMPPEYEIEPALPGDWWV